MTEPIDIFKETPLRYLAFTNDFGEVLRNSIGNKLANASYLVTAAYATGDVYNTYKRNLPNKELAIAEATDCAIWQVFASVLITPILLGSARYGLSRALLRVNVPHMVRHRAPEVIPLASIPFLVPYIDQKTDDLMDKYYRDVPKHRKHHGFWEL